MRARLPVRVMLTASLTFLASLYLTWVSATPATSSGSGSGVASLLNLMSVGGFGQSDGWGLLGQAAAIGAVALGLCALVSLIRPELEAALPIGGCAIALAALALSDAADLRTQGMYHAGLNGLSVHRGVGAYLGGAAALVALLSAAWLSHDDIPEPRIAAAATLLTMGLIAAYVLPTFSVHVHRLNGSLG